MKKLKEIIKDIANDVNGDYVDDGNYVNYGRFTAYFYANDNDSINVTIGVWDNAGEMVEICSDAFDNYDDISDYVSLYCDE